MKKRVKLALVAGAALVATGLGIPLVSAQAAVPGYFTTWVQQDLPVSTTSYYEVVASCGAGNQVLGGGYYETTGNTDPLLEVFRAAPEVIGSNYEYKVRAWNKGTSTATLRVFATCATVP